MTHLRESMDPKSEKDAELPHPFVNTVLNESGHDEVPDSRLREGLQHARGKLQLLEETVRQQEDVLDLLTYALDLSATALERIKRPANKLEKETRTLATQIVELVSVITTKELVYSNNDYQHEHYPKVDATVADSIREIFIPSPKPPKVESRSGDTSKSGLPKSRQLSPSYSVSALASEESYDTGSLTDRLKLRQPSSASGDPQNDHCVVTTPSIDPKDEQPPYVLHCGTAQRSEPFPPIRRLLKRTLSSSPDRNLATVEIARRLKRARTI